MLFIITRFFTLVACLVGSEALATFCFIFFRCTVIAETISLCLNISRMQPRIVEARMGYQNKSLVCRETRAEKPEPVTPSATPPMNLCRQKLNHRRQARALSVQLLCLRQVYP